MSDLTTLIPPIKGFRAAGVHAGLKKDGALDMALIVSDRPCVAAGIFTRNHAVAAPVLVSRAHLAVAGAQARAVVINTKCANALTGPAGVENARTMARMTAAALNVQPQQVLVMSTGVIGTHLPMPKIERGIALAQQSLGNDWERAARGMMTTDTRPKTAAITVRTPDGEYTVAGIAKGAGMIAPNMATMLAVLVTDAQLTLEQAQGQLSACADRSFNRIVVDGDTSTNDTVFLLANGASGVALRGDADEARFADALVQVMRHLAQAIVRDGEGATKFITLHVMGAQDGAQAHAIAHTIAASPLVKTAFFGHDPNWGRIIAAAGRAGVPFNPDSAQLWAAAGEQLPEEGRGLLLFKHGAAARYEEADAAAIFAQPSVYLTLDLGAGHAECVVWTCDLSRAYVDINADYRT